MEVGGRGDAGQAVQRDVVQVAAAARCPGSPQSPTLRLSRRPVELSGITLSSETDGSFNGHCNQFGCFYKLTNGPMLE